MYANRKGGKSFFVAFVQCLFLWITYNFINAIYPNGTDTDMNISPRDLSAGDNEPKPKRGWGCCEKWGGFNNINLICLSGAVMCWAFLLFLKGVVSDLSCPLILLGTEVSTWRYIWIKWPGNAPLWLSLTLATCWTKAPASQLFGQFAGGLHENKRDCQRKYKFNFGRKYLH